MLVVRAESYCSVTIVAKSLTLQAEVGAQVQLAGPNGLAALQIRNLAQDQTVVWRGIDVPMGSEDGLTFHPGVRLTDCAGAVVLEDARFISVPIGHPAGLSEGARIEQCDSVSFHRCTLRGAADPGLFVRNSSVSIYDSVCTGGTIQGAGMWVTGGEVFASGTQFVCGGLFVGDSVVLSNLNPRGAPVPPIPGRPHAEFLDCTFSPCPAGADVRTAAGTSTMTPSIAHQFASSALVRETQSLQFEFDGPPGELAFLLLSFTPGHAIEAPGLLGRLHLAAPLAIFNFGTMPMSGTLRVTAPLGDLGPLLSLDLFTQGIFFDAATVTASFSAPAATTILDSSF